MTWQITGFTPSVPPGRLGSKLPVMLLTATLVAGCTEAPTAPPAFPVFDVDTISGCPPLIMQACCGSSVTCKCTAVEGTPAFMNDLYYNQSSWGTQGVCPDGAEGADVMIGSGLAYWLDEPGICTEDYGAHLRDEEGEGSGVIYARRGWRNPYNHNDGYFSYLEHIQTLWHEGLSANWCGEVDIEDFDGCHANIHDLILEDDYENVCYDGFPDPV